MATENLALLREVANFTLSVARPIIWHDRAEPWPKQLNGATCFFLRFDLGIVGVTANHVIAAYETSVAENPNIVCQLRNSPVFDLSAAVIARDATRDIATFVASDALLSQIDAIPLDCRGSWPPPTPQLPGHLSACGFPESMHRIIPDQLAEFRAWGALATVESVTTDEILITYDPAVVQPASWAPVLPPIGFNMSGCSGGPVLLHGVRRGIHRWFAVGLIAQGPKGHKKKGEAAEFDMIRASRIDCIQPDGTIAASVKFEGGWLPI